MIEGAYNKTTSGGAANGTLVDDGNYVLRVEYTSEHAQGPLMAVSFSKGTAPVTVTPVPTKSISLTFLNTKGHSLVTQQE